MKMGETTYTLLAVTDMKKSIAFYTEILGYNVMMDMGGNVTLDKNLALQEMESWTGLLLEMPREAIRLGGNDKELVLETDEMEEFLALLESRPDVKQVHPLRTYPWGQRVIRVYDPDGHIIEVGENMRLVVKRFIREGMSLEEVAEITMYPPEFLAACKAEVEAEAK